MNKLFYLRSNRNGYYFVLGAGFTTTRASSASKLTQAQVNAVKVAGFEPSYTEAVQSSFAVNYVRQVDIVGGRVQQNANNPSSRRFATFDEAFQHGTQLRTRDESATHVGFYVTESSDAVNATINWKTGKTNAL